MKYYVTYYKDIAEKFAMMWVNAYVSTSMPSVNKDIWITCYVPGTRYRLVVQQLKLYKWFPSS